MSNLFFLQPQAQTQQPPTLCWKNGAEFNGADKSSVTWLQRRVGMTFRFTTVNDNVIGSRAPVTTGSAKLVQWSIQDTGDFCTPSSTAPFQQTRHTDPVLVTGSTPSLFTVKQQSKSPLSFWYMVHSAELHKGLVARAILNSLGASPRQTLCPVRIGLDSNLKS